MLLDKYLSHHNLVSSRQRAILLIKNSKVKVDNKIITNSKIRDLVRNIGLKEIGFCESPIKGGDGNIEYLIYLRK